MQLAIWLVFFVCAATDAAAAVVAPDAAAAVTNAAAELPSGKDFVYNGGNWPDPFVPFVKTEKAKKEENAAESLVGMRRFEPGQLNLVAIVRQNGTGVAMVEDSAGKGYAIREGTPVGRFGVVTKIAPGRVLITEKAPNPLGSPQEKTVTLELPGQ